MTTPDDGIAVVITCHDQERDIGEAIDSVLGQSRPPTSVVVVDDGSADGSPRVIGERLGAGVTMVTNPSAAGVCRARSQGAAQMTEPRLLFLDGDDRLAPGALAHLAEALDVHPEWTFAYPTVRSFGAETGVRRAEPLSPRELGRVNTIPVSALMRRSLFEELGGFDAGLDRIGFEDWDFWIRAVRAGHDGGPVPDAVLEWRRHGRAGSRNARARRRWLVARTWFWWRHRGFCPPPNIGLLVGRARPA